LINFDNGDDGMGEATMLNILLIILLCLFTWLVLEMIVTWFWTLFLLLIACGVCTCPES